MTYKEALRKRKLETALARPIVVLGQLLSWFFRPHTKHKLFLFAPSADIGGANMNNADLARVFVDMKPIVIFSKKPKNNQFRHLFDTHGVVVWDLHQLIDNKVYHFINIFYRGVISRWINKTDNAVVLGGESLYFHKVFPWLKRRIKTIELSHLGTWFDYTQQFVKDIDARVFSTRRLMEDAKAFYKKQSISEELTERMHFIDNMIPIPETPVYNQNDELQVVFIGRGSPQKRVNLIAEAAKIMHKKRLSVHFSFVGDVEKVINPAEYPYCTFYGNVTDRDVVEEIEMESDVLVLASKFEGLPMVVIEMMALGKVIVSTAVNAIPDYITDGVNGYLIPDHEKEKNISDDCHIALSILAADRTLLRKMGEQNRKDAEEKFGEKLFKEKWTRLLKDDFRGISPGTSSRQQKSSLKSAL